MRSVVGYRVPLDRITWSPGSDGSVRQTWESADAQGQWTVVFDGIYRRKQAAFSPAGGPAVLCCNGFWASVPPA